MTELINGTRLDELAATIKREHSEAANHLAIGIRHVVAVGAALLEARELIDRNDLRTWIEDECEIPFYTASRCMRLAFYQHLLPPGLKQQEAIAFLNDLPGIDGRAIKRYPDEVKTEARRRIKAGESLHSIANDFGISKTTIGRWFGKDGLSAKQRASQRRYLKRLEERESRRRAAREAAKNRGGSIASAYSLVRRLGDELDKAIASEDDPLAKRELKEALNRVHRAEFSVVTALGIDHGKP